MSTETLLAAARAVTDPLALLALGGSLIMLWALWHVLRHDIDLTDDDDPDRDDRGARPDNPSDLAGGGKAAR